ncbi:MAG: presenilin family intramembrane aspartyl protease PSH [Candidatus Methanoperedens sp.]
MKVNEYIPFIGMALMLLIVQLIAVSLGQLPEINEAKVFSDPNAPSNAIYWIALILVFTAFILYVIKKNKKWMIQAFILFTVASTLYIVFLAIFSRFLSLEISFFMTIALSIGLTVAMYKFPEWYVIDIVGILIGAGAASIFGISLAIIPTLLLLVLLLVYDYIAVYRTKHMIALAEGVMDLKLPILLVIPKHWNYSFLKETFDKEEREAFFMGLGDAVMPTILVVSANAFAKADHYILPFLGAVNMPALFAIVGTFVGFSVLMGFVIKGKPQAGLPFLNGGVILGYVVGSLIAGSPII